VPDVYLALKPVGAGATTPYRGTSKATPKPAVMRTGEGEALPTGEMKKEEAVAGKAIEVVVKAAEEAVKAVKAAEAAGAGEAIQGRGSRWSVSPLSSARLPPDQQRPLSTRTAKGSIDEDGAAEATVKAEIPAVAKGEVAVSEVVVNEAAAQGAVKAERMMKAEEEAVMEKTRVAMVSAMAKSAAEVVTATSTATEETPAVEVDAAASKGEIEAREVAAAAAQAAAGAALEEANAKVAMENEAKVKVAEQVADAFQGKEGTATAVEVAAE